MGEIARQAACPGVLVVCDIRLFREGLAQLLSGSATLTVTGVARDVASASSALRTRRADVVLLDVGCADGREIIEDTRAIDATIPIVGLGVGNSEEDVLSAIETGLSGYVSRDASLEDLLSAIESAGRGELHCSPQIAGSLLRRVASLSRSVPPPPLARLTSREADVANLLEQNLSNKEIAARLHIKVATVKNHVHSTLDKLNVRRRSEVVLAGSRTKELQERPRR